MSITITFTDEEARAVEAQLLDIEQRNAEAAREPLKCVRDELDRLEGARIKFSQANDKDVAHEQALIENAQHITTFHGIALTMNARKDRRAAAHNKMLNPTTAVELSKTVKYLAKKMIDAARRDRSYPYGTFFTHRGIEVLAITNGERTGNGEPDFFELKHISGKALEESVAGLIKYFDECNVEEICIQGGLDSYESFSIFMEDSRVGGYADYEPMVEEFDITVPVSIFKSNRR